MNLKERVPWIDLNGLSERIYTRLKETILEGKFLPGERLSAEDLARHFQVSITPVRDALKRLEGDALVEVVPRQGVFVSKFSAEVIREIFEIRQLIEHACLERLGEVADETIQQISGLVQQMETLRDGDKFRDYLRFIDLDTQFHALLVTLRGNQRLSQLYEELQWPVQVIRGLARTTYQRAEETMAEHRAIVEAISERNVVKAQEKVAAHIRNAMQDLLQHMASNAKDERVQS